MNLPNQLTLMRLVMTAVFVAVMSTKFPLSNTIGLGMFALAAVTDFLDGWIARRYNMVTNFGKLMDPLADKVLMCAVWVLLTQPGQGDVPAWAVILILSREFLVTGLRLLAAGQGIVVAADSLGKQKTIWQFITAMYFLLYLASSEQPLHFLSPIFAYRWTGVAYLGKLLWVFALVLTVWSGIGYVWRNRHVLSAKP